jgi:hypothetical protein
MDIGITLPINFYIPEPSLPEITRKLEQMLAEDRPFEWIYRRFQLGSWLFVPDAGLPYAINLRLPEPYRVKFDWIETPAGERIEISYGGNYPQTSREAVVDCPMEITLEDLRNKMNFTQSYAQLNPALPPEFDYEVHVQKYYLPKFIEKDVTRDHLDRFGKIIAQNSRPDFLSQYIMKKHRNYWRRMNKFQKEKTAYLSTKLSNLLKRLNKAIGSLR